VVLGEYPELRQDALAGTNVGGGKAEGFLALVGGEEPVGIVGEEVAKLRICIDLEVEGASTRRVGGEIRGHRIAKNGDARQFLPIDGAYLDLGHALSVRNGEFSRALNGQRSGGEKEPRSRVGRVLREGGWSPFLLFSFSPFLLPPSIWVVAFE
jgi:hypothetical protein